MWVPVIERVVRCRSAYLIRLKSRRFLWLAKLMCSLEMLLHNESYGWIKTPKDADFLCEHYRNWMGENRVEYR